MSAIDFSDLRLLGIFITVVETGSFSAAARKLKTSRSRVSEQVSQLEQRLGTRLLQRTTRKLTTTSEGLHVYEYARKLPDIIKDIEAVVTPSTPTGRVSITLNQDIAHRYLLPSLEGFSQQFPDIQLDLILDDDKLDLIDNQIDLAIRIGMPEDDSLVARVLHTGAIALYASPEYLRRAGGMPASVEALEQCQWVLFYNRFYSGLVFHDEEKNATVELRPERFYRVSSPYLIQKMVFNGLGVGPLLTLTASEEVSRGGLQAIMPNLSIAPMQFSLIYPSRRHMPLRTRAVIDYLLQANLFADV